MINPTLVEPEHPDAERSYHLLTVNLETEATAEYFFRVREHSTAMAFLASANLLESQALLLWKKSDSLELEDLLSLLEQNPPTPQLIAMIMLMAKSTFRSKSDGALGGKAKSDKFKPLREKLQSDWKNSTGRLNKKRFADERYYDWEKTNKELIDSGQQPMKLPHVDTPKRWLNNIKRENNQKK
ncbi:MAG: hypothetical protein JWR68_1753 [Polaromonas sp.]|nr:hypothetical protein [Polaromonas sp.]